MIVYGIKSCDTVKKALNWLTENNIEYKFHDYKKEGISSEKLDAWSSQRGWEILVNKKGTTWKNLTEQEKEAVTDQKSAVALMKEKTSVIKRPVIEGNGKLIVGFNEKEYVNEILGPRH